MAGILQLPLWSENAKIKLYFGVFCIYLAFKEGSGLNCDFLIVGAGLFGCVLAERIASSNPNVKILLVDKRTHIGGNCYSEVDKDTGIEFHKYGTHIFHTSSKKVWDYLNNFTEFNGYHHQVLTTYKNRTYQMPINLETINSFYNLNLNPTEAREFLKKEIDKAGIGKPKNLEEKAISLIGRPLYKAFIEGYTTKQWGTDPKKLPASIITRLPVKYNYNEDYFVDSRWQGIPSEGYDKMFHRMLDYPNIHIELNSDYFEYKDEFKYRKRMFYTGQIDRYFDYVYGKLEWRSIRLEKDVVDVDDYQGTSVMNHADLEIGYTRTHEPRHLHPERKYSKRNTLIFREMSIHGLDDPYYPINDQKNQELFQKYKKLSMREKTVTFGGRLGSYKYYDMDKVILAAFDCYENELKGIKGVKY